MRCCNYSACIMYVLVFDVYKVILIIWNDVIFDNKEINSVSRNIHCAVS